jgi:hypothetical protein
MQKTISNNTTNFHKIGEGFCGSVWSPAQEDPKKTFTFKREDGGPERSLSNDFAMHKRAIEGFRYLADLKPPQQTPHSVLYHPCRFLIATVS